MAGVLEGVNQRTQLAGHNRLELLLFKLHSNQRFGINVFKVQEVIQCPKLTQIPQASSVVCGVAHLRGRTIPVLDLSMAIGGQPHPRHGEGGYVIVTEYNRTVQGFLVSAVDRIINMGWDEIKAPPEGLGNGNYLTAVTRVENELISVIDVEKVAFEVTGNNEDISAGIIDESFQTQDQHILVADDSSVARNQVKRVLDQLGVPCTMARDGDEALKILLQWADEGRDLSQFLAMIISDIEMPNMDGYTLTTRIRENETLKHLYVILHTSLSGVFNQAMVEKVGANQFLAKYQPDELATLVQARLQEHQNELEKLAAQ